jgi:hypothetical protein
MTKRSYATPTLMCLGDILALTRASTDGRLTEMFDQFHYVPNQ